MTMKIQKIDTLTNNKAHATTIVYRKMKFLATQI